MLACEAETFMLADPAEGKLSATMTSEQSRAATIRTSRCPLCPPLLRSFCCLCRLPNSASSAADTPTLHLSAALLDSSDKSLCEQDRPCCALAETSPPCSRRLMRKKLANRNANSLWQNTPTPSPSPEPETAVLANGHSPLRSSEEECVPPFPPHKHLDPVLPAACYSSYATLGGKPHQCCMNSMLHRLMVQPGIHIAFRAPFAS